jgi:hypothetical protein
MMRWDFVTRPKEFSGLGNINTRIMNDCLLTKSIWKMYEGSSEVWYRLRRSKHMRNNDFSDSKNRGSSQFWQGLHKVTHLF